MSGVSDDGSPVEVYRRLPETGEADLVASVVPPGSTGVLLGSHFVNDPEPLSILETCARHVDDDGVVLVEAYPPGLDWTAGRETRLGDVVVRLVEAERTGDRVRATVEYTVGGRAWRQAFEAELRDEDGLTAALARAGLSFTRWLDRDRGWLEARPA